MKRFNEMRYHRATGQWYVRIDGVQTYLGSLESRAREIWESLREKHYQNTSSSSISPPPIGETGMGVHAPQTLSGVVDRYLDYIDSRPIRRCQWFRIRSAMSGLVEHYGGLRPAEFRAKAFKSLREKFVGLNRAHGDRRPISRRWVNFLCAEVKVFVRWAAEEELIPAETAASIQLVKALRINEGGTELSIRMPPEPGAVEATLQYLPSPVREMVSLQLLTGLRPGELCTLKRGHFSTAPSEVLTIPHTRKKVAAMDVEGTLVWLYVPPEHKTQKRGKYRLIPIGPMGQKILAPFLAGRSPEDYLFVPTFKPKRHRWGFVSKAKSFLPYHYYGAINRAILKGNKLRSKEVPPKDPIPHWSPYQIRHQAATEIGDQYDSEHAAAILGHSGLDTIDVYMRQQLGKALKVAAERG